MIPKPNIINAEIEYCNNRHIPYKIYTLEQIRDEYKKYRKEHDKND